MVRINPQSEYELSNASSPRGSHLITLILGLFSFTLAICETGCKWNGAGSNGAGVSLYQQGRYAEALNYFETAKQSDPTNPDTYYNLASTYHRLGNTSKDKKMLETAESLYNGCLDLSPNHVDCHRGLAVLLVDTGKSDRGFELLKRWAQRNPGMSEPRVELARLHQEFNQGKIAEQYLDEALAMDPNNAKAWAARGKMRESSGELMQAVQNYQQSLAINSQQPELYQRVSALNVRLTQNTLTNPTTIASNPTTNPAGNVNPTAVNNNPSGNGTKPITASAPSQTNSATNPSATTRY